MRIKTEYVNPPIGYRGCDWIAVDDATYDGDGSPIGRGSTEIDAIRDLLDQIEDRISAASVPSPMTKGETK